MGDLLDKHAVKAIGCANQIACEWGHEYVQPEHLLLGLIREGSVLELSELPGICEKKEQLTTTIQRDWIAGPHAGKLAKLPMHSLAKVAIEIAMEYVHIPREQVGTTHLLIGLLLLPGAPLDGTLSAIDVDANELAQRLSKTYGKRDTA